MERRSPGLLRPLRQARERRDARATDERPDRKSCPAWSPDGRRIAFLRHPKGKRSVLAVIPALGGDEKAVPRPRPSIPGSPGRPMGSRSSCRVARRRKRGRRSSSSRPPQAG
ncbi:MAG: PD40 domain-containing protein [Holophagales bacterium]|nr:PD40 domain-containing protein [Holophagales bacterium]